MKKNKLVLIASIGKPRGLKGEFFLNSYSNPAENILNYSNFLKNDDISVNLYGVEAAGKGLNTNEHAASLSLGSPGVLHGNRTYLLHNNDGQIIEAHSISAGLDYPGVGPEHSYLKDVNRVNYVGIKDDEALEAFKFCAKLEGILPALEPSHALAYVMKIAPKLDRDHIIIMNLCGRGDKDVFTVADALGVKL